MLSDAERIDLQAETLFTHNAAGRLLRLREPNGGPAPRFFLGRTATSRTLRVRADVSAGCVREIERLVRAEPITADVRSDPAALDAVRAILARDAPVRREYRGPAYRFSDPIAPPPDAVAITRANAHLGGQGFSWLVDEVDERQPCCAVVRGGEAVALCFCARRSTRAAEAGVETLEPYRGRGYATAVTAGWALAVRALGLVPFYSTSWNNLASQGVARRLGLICYGSNLHLT
jgi:RimJ/RimL family protein N-acetyltransferase